MSSNNAPHLDIDPCDIETDMSAQVAELQNELRAVTLEKDKMEMAKDIAVAMSTKLLADQSAAGAPSAVAPGSGKKIIYTEAMHKITHAKVVALTAPALLELKKLENNENNYEAVWWCAKHIEALGKGDKPDGYDKYTVWAADPKHGDVKRAALKSYMPLSAEALAAGSP